MARLDAVNASEDQKIVELFISLSRRLNLAVVAEGVERTTQKDILAGLDCQFAQGFLYYRPMPPEMIQADYLKRVLGLEKGP